MLPLFPFLLCVLPGVMSCLASSCAKYLSLILPTLPETLSMPFPVLLVPGDALLGALFLL